MAVLKVHREITAEHRDTILAALDECEAANQTRNSLVHGIKVGIDEPDAVIHTIRSRRGRLAEELEQWSRGELSEAANAALLAYDHLDTALRVAVSSEMMLMASALTMEELPVGPPLEVSRVQLNRVILSRYADGMTDCDIVDALPGVTLANVAIAIGTLTAGIATP